MCVHGLVCGQRLAYWVMPWICFRLGCGMRTSFCFCDDFPHDTYFKVMSLQSLGMMINDRRLLTTCNVRCIPYSVVWLESYDDLTHSY